MPIDLPPMGYLTLGEIFQMCFKHMHGMSPADARALARADGTQESFDQIYEARDSETTKLLATALQEEKLPVWLPSEHGKPDRITPDKLGIGSSYEAFTHSFATLLFYGKPLGDPYPGAPEKFDGHLPVVQAAQFYAWLKKVKPAVPAHGKGAAELRKRGRPNERDEITAALHAAGYVDEKLQAMTPSQVKSALKAAGQDLLAAKSDDTFGRVKSAAKARVAERTKFGEA